jgi:F-type H+-transporting ATPase subunit delta
MKKFPKTIAKPYAQAVFSIALEQNKLEAWYNFLEQTGRLVVNSEIKAILHHPLVSTEKLLQLFQPVLEKYALQKEGSSFLKQLIQYKRLELLPYMADIFYEKWMGHENKVVVKVTSAYELDNEESLRLQQALEKKLNKKIDMHYMVDSALVGGAIVQIDDFIVDGSALNQLNQLKEYLRKNSELEIEN